jgi:hypothetical protein
MGRVAAWGMAVLAEQGNSLGSQCPEGGTAADFVIAPPCPAKAMPSIDKVEHIQPYLFAGHQQLVVSDCHPMEQN